MFTKTFLLDLGERAVFTFAQALGALLVGAGTGLIDTNWMVVLSLAGMAALLAILKGIAAYGFHNDTGASFLTTIPKGDVAAIERTESPTGYVADEAAPVAEGTPVEVQEAKFLFEHEKPRPEYLDLDHQVESDGDEQ